jgi:hypothetical protein
MTTILLAFQGHITRLSDFQKFAHLPQFNELIKSLNENIEVKINPVFQERILAFIETAINHAKQVRTEHA